MKTVTALLLAGLLVLAACSDDKGSSSSSSSSSSSRSDDKDDDKDDKDDKKEDAEKKEEPGDDKEPTVTPGKTEPAAPVAERGFKESKQPEAANADGTEIVANQQHKAGERLKVSSLGFSYVVPEGQISYFASGTSAINVGEVNGNFITVIIARTGVSEAEARDMINTPWELGGDDRLGRTSEIEKNGDRLSCAIASKKLTGYLEMLIGKSTGVSIATLGLPGSEKECKSRCSKLADTVKFAVPAGEKQRLEHEAGLMGKRIGMFHYSGSSDYGSSSETNKDWHFGSDHTYEYLYRNTNASSFKDGGGLVSDNTENHSGTWSIELTLGYPSLILRASDGRIFTYTLTVVKSWLHMDGKEVSSFGASDRKR